MTENQAETVEEPIAALAQQRNHPVPVPTTSQQLCKSVGSMVGNLCTIFTFY